MRQQFGKRAGDAGYDDEVELDGDGAMGLSDFNVFRGLFGRAPGPSGLGCAGTIPCPGP